MVYFIFAILAIGVIFYLNFFIPIGYYQKAKNAEVNIKLSQLIGMRLRKIPLKKIINDLIRAKLLDIDIDPNQLEIHHLAGGRTERVVDALILAKKKSMDVDTKTLIALDLAGHDPNECVEKNNLTPWGKDCNKRD